MDPDTSLLIIEILGTGLLELMDSVLSEATIPLSKFWGIGILELSLLSFTIFSFWAMSFLGSTNNSW